MQTGAFAHGVANVIVTEVRAVPATAILPELSFDGEFMLDVPPDTVGCFPPVLTCPLLSIANVVLPVDEATANGFVVPDPVMESVEPGVDEPIPTLPDD